MNRMRRLRQFLPDRLDRILRPAVVHGLKAARTLAYHLNLYRLTGQQLDGLHLGSGDGRIAGFLNMDANPAAQCDVVAWLEKLKLASNSVGVIYTSHVFEHIPRSKTRRVLSEWYRVLKPGGELYICVPDLEALCHLYLDNIKSYEEERSRYVADMACGVAYGGQVNKYDFHFYGYSLPTLSRLLEGAGFRNVARFDRAAFALYPARDAAFAAIEGVPVSLNLRASK
jgi:SAM-dependent methyltransferase